MLKRPNPVDEQDRFKGQLRHYHRSGSTAKRTWDEWVDGKAAKTQSRNWLKIILISVSVLGLGAVIAGLIIELG